MHSFGLLVIAIISMSNKWNVMNVKIGWDLIKFCQNMNFWPVNLIEFRSEFFRNSEFRLIWWAPNFFNFWIPKPWQALTHESKVYGEQRLPAVLWLSWLLAAKASNQNALAGFGSGNPVPAPAMYKYTSTNDCIILLLFWSRSASGCVLTVLSDCMNWILII